MSAVRGLYPIVDLGLLDARGIDPERFSMALLDSAPPFLQLRAKDANDARIVALASTLLPLCERSGTRFVINDRADIAAQVGAPFVHVGQGDMSAAALRSRYPGLSFGTSTHTAEQLGLALADAPAYVAYGPVFDTKTKMNPDATVGLEGLRAAHRWARAAGIPLVAIGGIDEARLLDVARSADLVSVISSLVPDIAVNDASFYPTVTRGAQRFQQTILHAADEALT